MHTFLHSSNHICSVNAIHVLTGMLAFSLYSNVPNLQLVINVSFGTGYELTRGTRELRRIWRSGRLVVSASASNLCFFRWSDCTGSIFSTFLRRGLKFLVLSLSVYLYGIPCVGLRTWRNSFALIYVKWSEIAVINMSWTIYRSGSCRIIRREVW
jgi:hypothetical protein